MRMVDRVATTSRVPAILADAGGRQRTTGGGHGSRLAAAGGRRRTPETDNRRQTANGEPAAGLPAAAAAAAVPRRSTARPPATAMKNGRPEGRPCGATNRGWTRYSAMSADAFAGRAGTAPGACDGVAMSIFGGGDSCSTSLVYVHSSTTFAGLSFSLVP